MPIRGWQRHQLEHIVINAITVSTATAEELWNYQESRGLARALTDNNQGAIEDFDEFIQKPVMKSLKSSARLGYRRYVPVIICLPKRYWLICRINNRRLFYQG
jgi:hypothetical protein